MRFCSEYQSLFGVIVCIRYRDFVPSPPLPYNTLSSRSVRTSILYCCSEPYTREPLSDAEAVLSVACDALLSAGQHWVFSFASGRTHLESNPIKFCVTCRLVSLEVLELRENLIKSLPDTMARLSRLRSLDLGTNELSVLVRCPALPSPVGPCAPRLSTLDPPAPSILISL